MHFLTPNNYVMISNIKTFSPNLINHIPIPVLGFKNEQKHNIYQYLIASKHEHRQKVCV